jgi:hypothetical protein
MSNVVTGLNASTATSPEMSALEPLRNSGYFPRFLIKTTFTKINRIYHFTFFSKVDDRLCDVSQFY